MMSHVIRNATTQLSFVVVLLISHTNPYDSDKINICIHIIDEVIYLYIELS